MISRNARSRYLVVVLGLLLGTSQTALSKSTSTAQREQDRGLDTRLEQRIERSRDRQDTRGITGATAPSGSVRTTGASHGQPEPSSVSASGPGSFTPEEIVAAIELRAQEELSRQRARKWNLDTLWIWTVANETNPNLSKAHKSSLSTEEYLGLTFSYRMHPRLTWQIGYSGDAFNYNEFTDLSTITNSLTTKLIWRVAQPFQVEAHYVYDDNTYPYNSGTSTWDQTIHVRARHDFLQHYYHYVGWSYLNRQYKDQDTLDGTSNSILGKYRKDQRHTGIYEVGSAWRGHTTLRVRQEAYLHRSNAAFQNFYDAVDYKVKLSGAHDWTERWSSAGGVAYELKRYTERELPDRAVAERDHATTYQLGLTYRLSPDVDLAYTWRYVRQHSNDPTQKFGDITNSLALTAVF